MARQAIEVAVRVRPDADDGRVEAELAEMARKGGAARVFGRGATQEQVYASCGAPLVDALFDGYDGCLFAYGQTGACRGAPRARARALLQLQQRLQPPRRGSPADARAAAGSGKTHTMLGPDGGRAPPTATDAGIIPRVAGELFRQVKRQERDAAAVSGAAARADSAFEVTASYVEVQCVAQQRVRCLRLLTRCQPQPRASV